jgi:hypothetical protein
MRHDPPPLIGPRACRSPCPTEHARRGESTFSIHSHSTQREGATSAFSLCLGQSPGLGLSGAVTQGVVSIARQGLRSSIFIDRSNSGTDPRHRLVRIRPVPLAELHPYPASFLNTRPRNSKLDVSPFLSSRSQPTSPVQSCSATYLFSRH